LPEVSQIISNAINAATDALSEALETLPAAEQEALLPLFRAHLPKTIADLSFDDVHKKVPAQYIKNAIASCLASKLVYKEGTMFIASMPKDKLATTALKYMDKEKEIAVLIESVKHTDMPAAEKEQVLKLLNLGGTRTALQAL
jgi:glutamate dehydrogenase